MINYRLKRKLFSSNGKIYPRSQINQCLIISKKNIKFQYNGKIKALKLCSVQHAQGHESSRTLIIIYS